MEGVTAEVGIESTFVDVSRIEQGMGPALLRPGHISAAQIEAVLCGKLLRPDQSAPRVSGSLKAHYAPRTPLALLDRDTLLLQLARFSGKRTEAAGERLAVVVFDDFPRPDGVSGVDWYRARAEPDAYARDLDRKSTRLNSSH